MTDEELAGIKNRLYDSDQRVAAIDRQGRGGFSKPLIRESYEPRESASAYRELGRSLLAELDHLRERAAALREIVQRLAATRPVVIESTPRRYVCPGCYRLFMDDGEAGFGDARWHSEGCLVIQARASVTG